MKSFSFWRFIAFLGVLVGAFIFLTTNVMNGGVDKLDQYVMNVVKPLQSDFFTIIMMVFSFIGATMPVIIISCLLLLVIYRLYRNWHEVLLFIVVLSGSTALNLFLKYSFKRERPLSQLVTETGFSYPSGHMMAAVSLYGIITFLFWKHIQTFWRRILLLILCTMMILIIGFSRIYLGVHYTSDIIGAFLISGMWLYVTIRVYRFLMAKKSG